MLYSRAGYRSARPIPSIAHFRLATHGRSIQIGSSQKNDKALALKVGFLLDELTNALKRHVRLWPKADILIATADVRFRGSGRELVNDAGTSERTRKSTSPARERTAEKSDGI